MLKVGSESSVVTHEGDDAESEFKRKKTLFLGAVAAEKNAIDPKEDWHPVRKSVASILNHRYYDTCVGLLAALSLFLVIIDTDHRAADIPSPDWLNVINFTCLLVFSIEALLQVYVRRADILSCKWTVFDMTIVAADVIVFFVEFLWEDVPSVAFLRLVKAVRVLRFVRVVRTLKFFHELYYMLHGFVSAMRAIFWSTVLLFVMLTVWAIVAVEFIHPVNERVADAGLYQYCERCPRAYSSVAQSILTMVQVIVANDSWGLVAVPVIETEPGTAFIFMAVLISVQLGLLNLILTVIVDRAAQARKEDRQFILRERQVEFENAKRELLDICSKLDKDGSGNLSLTELMYGYDSLPEFANIMAMMDISRDELHSLFNILDEDGSGDVAYPEFVEQMHKMKSQDSQMLLVFIRSNIKELRGSVNQMLRLAKEHFRQDLEDGVKRISSEVHHAFGKSPPMASTSPPVPGASPGAPQIRTPIVAVSAPPLLSFPGQNPDQPHRSDAPQPDAGGGPTPQAFLRPVPPPAANAPPLASNMQAFEQELCRLREGLSADLAKAMAGVDSLLSSLVKTDMAQEFAAAEHAGHLHNPFKWKVAAGAKRTDGMQVEGAGAPKAATAKTTWPTSRRRSSWSTETTCCDPRRGKVDVDIVGREVAEKVKPSEDDHLAGRPPCKI